MTTLLEREPDIEIVARPILSEYPVCAMTALRLMPTEQAQLTRQTLQAEAEAMHDRALTASLERESQGISSVVRVEAVGTVPNLVGPELLAVLAHRRKLAGRELAPHPRDPRKCLIVARQIGYTICR